MSEKLEASKILLKDRLKYYLDRFRMPRLNAELALVERRLYEVRNAIREITSQHQSKNINNLRSQLNSLRIEILGEDVKDIEADDKRIDKRYSEHIEARLGALVIEEDSLKSMRQRILGILDAQEAKKDEEEKTGARARSNACADGVLRHVEQLEQENGLKKAKIAGNENEPVINIVGQKKELLN